MSVSFAVMKEAVPFTATMDADGVQKAQIVGGSYFFKPNDITVKVNVPVEFKVSKESGIIPHNISVKAPEAGMAASRKFKDTLTGRKRLVHLTPVLWDELPAFDETPLKKRLFHGGLPQALLAPTKDPSFYREWMDSFFAGDIQRLFAFRNPDKFNALFEYVMKQSGGLLETARAAGALGISRPTVENHLAALEITHAVTLLRPFHGGGKKEIVRMPKAYAFDTGFVSFSRGWDPLRQDDHGLLWEHLVLEYLQAHGHKWKIHYWRDAAGREVDFVIPRNRDRVDAIECKWDPERFDSEAIKLFRSYYPQGVNYLICPLGGPAQVRRSSGLEVRVCNPDGWREHALTQASRRR